ncbi:hypothetical protein [Polyangium mundeleinium]|uniref:Uncharacterized protein n=1 Tax=Polyangium mundeleinium TaxID=2995306 RepID=A0ABT5EJD3_9BACT|nr:hypothetical protein [Polyangium mundeleinium]MDC0741938.1 hypothetical protein [Polyangium mundeleinium]
MRPAERARSAAFVAALVDEPARGEHATGLARVPRVVVAMAAVVLVFGSSAHHEVPRAEPTLVADDVARAEPRHGFARVPDEPSTRVSEDEGEDVPGRGDVCGRNVCDLEPSCCEGVWDERCDRTLLELTRVTSHASPVRAGRCYWHDRESCPGCACPMYLKRVEELPRGDDPGTSLGYDGGSGCLRDRRRLLSNMKWMCVEGFCEE